MKSTLSAGRSPTSHLSTIEAWEAAGTNRTLSSLILGMKIMGSIEAVGFILHKWVLKGRVKGGYLS